MLTDHLLTGVIRLHFCSDSDLPKLLYEARCHMQVRASFEHHEYFSRAVSHHGDSAQQPVSQKCCQQ